MSEFMSSDTVQKYTEHPAITAKIKLRYKLSTSGLPNVGKRKFSKNNPATITRIFNIPIENGCMFNFHFTNASIKKQ